MTRLDYCKKKRYQKTILFLKKHMPPPCKILDLGNSNLRAAQSEISQYTLTWNRYVTNFYVKGDQE